MYVTRFTRTDGNIEEYYYHDLKDAERHLKDFQHDDSGLYSLITVEDEDNRVSSMIEFTNGIPQPMLTADNTRLFIVRPDPVRA